MRAIASSMCDIVFSIWAVTASMAAFAGAI